MPQTLWHSLEVKEALKEIKTAAKGLSQKEARERLEDFGPNKLPEERRLSRFQIFLCQFKSPLIYILLAAAVISFFLKEFVDMGVILAAVVLNTIFGFIQEDKANRAITKLRKLVEYKARVLREGKEEEVKSEELVPGDIIFLEAGDKIPADARIFEVNNFEVNEASLTGESLPITKATEALDEGTVLADRKNMVHMGTIAARGKARAVVCATGPRTHLGEITALVKEVAEERTPLQKKLDRLGKFLGIAVLGICALILILGLLVGRSFFDMFVVAVAVAVSAIPEGLLVAITIILAIGMQRILRRKALVRKLIAAETLGSTSVICTDKTGTLTEGEMKVAKILTSGKELALDGQKIFAQEEESHMLALRIGLLNNNAVIKNPEEDLKDWIVMGDPTETALLLAAIQAGLDKGKLKAEMPRLDEIPFEAERKYMATLHKLNESQNIIYVKGAPERVLGMSSFVDVGGVTEKLDAPKRENIKRKGEDLTRRGLRVLAVGYQKIPNTVREFKEEASQISNLVFVGFLGLKDPLRREAKKTIKLCQSAGIRPVMVTGDHKLTARAIYEELGLSVKEENILEGEGLDKISDEELKKLVKKIDIYARVEPKHKLRIVDAWQARGEVVAMTGDGVNDAPALKAADIGVALGTGTDVAKESSDIILLDNNFNTIVRAIEQGRVIFDNIRKVVLYLLSDAFCEMFIIVVSLLLGWPLPILATQILWVNLIDDSFPAIALTVEPKGKGIMKEPPRKIKEPILNFPMKFLIFLISSFVGISVLGLFYYIWQLTGDLDRARTVAFTVLGLSSLLYVFSCRSLRESIFRNRIFRNKYLIIAVLAGVFLQLVAVYLPFLQKIFRTVALGWKEWGLILLVCFSVIIAIEITKLVFVARKKKTAFQSW